MSAKGYDATSEGALDIVDTVKQCLSQAFYHVMYPGSCSGGYEFENFAELDLDVAVSLCESLGFAETGSTRAPVAYGETPAPTPNMGSIFETKFEYRPLDSRRLTEEEELAEIEDEQRRLQTTRAGLTTMYDAMQSFCQDFVDGVEEPVFTYSGYGGDYEFALVQGNSWASYLKKEIIDTEPEFVVAFQGTKAEDTTMVQYNTRLRPTFTFIGDVPTIVPEGQYAYMKSLIDCMSWMIQPDNGFSIYEDASYTEPTFITGHSLGGAAATLFAKSNSDWVSPSDPSGQFPRLVTFGAAPNAYRGNFRADYIKCADTMGDSLSATRRNKRKLAKSDYYDSGGECGGSYYTLSNRGFDDYSDDIGGIGNYCAEANQDSVRFFHIFDPVPSIGMWGGLYGHAVEHAMMLWDTPDSSCESNVGCQISSGTLKSGKVSSDYGFGGSDPFMIKDYLCDKWGVEPKSMHTDCYDFISSYNSILNPWPCGNIVAMRVWSEEVEDSQVSKIGDAGTIDLGTDDGTHLAIDFLDLSYNIFQKFQEYVDCVEAYEATLSSFIQMSIIDAPKFMGLMFTFTWVHSTYGMYPLCTGKDGSGGVTSVNVDSTDTAGMITNECSTSEIATCKTSCDTDSSGDCMWDCMYSCFYESY
jgi:hypothetical protein